MSSQAISEKSAILNSQGRPSQISSLQWVLVYGLCAQLIFGVIAFGTVDEWSMFIFEVGAGALFLVWAATQVISKEIRISKNPLYLPAFLFLTLIVAQIELHGSAYSYVTRYEALQYISYGIVLLIAADCVSGHRTRKRFGQVMMAFGILYSFFALAQDLTGNGKIFWVHSPRFHGSIYGSYVNHDHYAGLMEMLVPIPLVFSMGQLFQGGRRALVGFAAVLMASTIFLSGSRGGMLAFAAEIALFSALALIQKKNPTVVFGAMAVCLLVLAFLLFLGKGKVLGRLGDLGPDIRWSISKDCLRMFAQRPLWGWGLGTFPTVYPSYRSFYTNLFVNEAHNDYAQLLVETGLAGFGLMLWFVIALYRHSLINAQHWQYRWDAAVSLAALLGCSGILLHSFVDFNLQIPANSACFYVFCAMAATRLGPSRASRFGVSNAVAVALDERTRWQARTQR